MADGCHVISRVTGARMHFRAADAVAATTMTQTMSVDEGICEQPGGEVVMRDTIGEHPEGAPSQQRNRARKCASVLLRDAHAWDCLSASQTSTVDGNVKNDMILTTHVCWNVFKYHMRFRCIASSC